MMMKDPIVEELRAARKKHALRFNFDLHEICADLKKKEMDCGYPIKSLPPKIVQTATENNTTT